MNLKTETLPTGTLSVRFDVEKKSQPADTMNDTLFDMEPSLSPRLRWMEKHGIVIKPNPENPDKPWIATMDKEGWGGINYPLHMLGQTEDAALTALALAAGIKLWNEGN